jgi:hypothetical protein
MININIHGANRKDNVVIISNLKLSPSAHNYHIFAYTINYGNKTVILALFLKNFTEPRCK